MLNSFTFLCVTQKVGARDVNKVYLYIRSGDEATGTWPTTPNAIINRPAGATGANFGHDVAIDGTAMVG